MSWLYSQALVVEYLEATNSDGEPFAPLSGNPTPQAYLSPDRMKAFSRPSRFGMTFAPLTDDHGEALLTWYLEGFPARTSALRVVGQELTENDQASGVKCRASLAKFSRATSSWKTAQRSLLGDSDESSVIWPRSGMTADGKCWELPMSERRTSGTGSGLWPTPQTRGFTNDGDLMALGRMFDSYEEMSRMAYRAADKKKQQYWPTPTVCGNYNRKGASPTSGDDLATAVLKCATPTARDWKSGKASQATMERNSRPLSEQIGGSLNPTWVEWLMGWPLGWTDLKPSATDKFLSVPQQPGDC